MRTFNNLTARVKLLISFGVIWIMFLAVILVAYRGINEITRSEKELHDLHFQIALDIKQLRSHQNRQAFLMAEMMLRTNTSDQEINEKAVRVASMEVDTILNELFKLSADQFFEKRLEELKDTLVVFRATREDVIALIKSGKNEEAAALRFRVQKPRENWMHSLNIEMGNKTIKEVDDQLALDLRESRRSVSMFIIFGLLTLLFSILIVSLLQRSIGKPLETIAGIASGIFGRDDLNINFPYLERGDEIGKLTRAFRQMVENISNSTADISERIKMEKELRSASLYARNLIEASLDPLVTISSEGKITDVNSTTIQATGVSREILIGSDFADYFAEPERARIGYKKVFSDGIVRDYPLTLLHASGSTIDVLYNASIYKNEAGEVQGVFAAARDITDRKKMEKEMRTASLYARNLIEASLDPLVTISSEGKITDVNNTTIKVTGVSREKLIGSDFADYFTDPEKARAGYKLVFSQGIVRDYPLTLRNADGLTTDVLYNASVYKNEEGLVQGVFAAARDITELKRQENELSNYRDQLEEKVRQRTADLTNVLLEVKDTVNVIASSSSQILAATTQVATGTSETASAISETTTTVEEVQQAAKLSAQKAKNVADSAQRVVQVSQNGQKAVEETLNGMNRIREQMDSIAQTIIRLSEQSQSIGGIISSVTDIADQSNLLAVNAAIEAAKAGEHGRGFAVVAQEIKNLAGQSKQSTLQVRNILNDVQKATSAAVMATEQGSKAVEAGVKQSAQTGEAIRILTESSNEAVQAATQIVASSQQQVVGMDQISVAMQNINQAGTETAVSMVQSEKSARSLHELGQKLKELVERFKV
jgi:PAS domain S-box-containing protein